VGGPLAGLALLYLAGSWLTARAQSVDVEALDVYVVLPFEGLDDEDAGELVRISERYRATLETVLGGLASVRVIPPAYGEETLREAPPQCTYQRVGVWTEGSDASPDLVLCSVVNLFPGGDGEATGLKVVSTLRKVRQGRLELLDRFETVGMDSEVSWLALLTTFDVVRSLHADPEFGLSAGDEATVMARALEEYATFLSFLGDAGAEAARAVDELRASGRADGDRVGEALAAYESPVVLDVDAARHERIRDALLRRIGGAP